MKQIFFEGGPAAVFSPCYTGTRTFLNWCLSQLASPQVLRPPSSYPEGRSWIRVRGTGIHCVLCTTMVAGIRHAASGCRGRAQAGYGGQAGDGGQAGRRACLPLLRAMTSTRADCWWTEEEGITRMERGEVTSYVIHHHTYVSSQQARGGYLSCCFIVTV